jgi:hypothetical protein
MHSYLLLTVLARDRSRNCRFPFTGRFPVLASPQERRARQCIWPNRVQHCFAYGLVFRFRLLSTPPLNDAVTFSYGQASVPVRKGLSPFCWCVLSGAPLPGTSCQATIGVSLRDGLADDSQWHPARERASNFVTPFVGQNTQTDLIFAPFNPGLSTQTPSFGAKISDNAHPGPNSAASARSSKKVPASARGIAVGWSGAGVCVGTSLRKGGVWIGDLRFRAGCTAISPALA